MTAAELASVGVEISHHFVADEIYTKRSIVPAGTDLAKHTHDYDHASALVRGTVLLTVDGEEALHTGPCMLLVKAGRAHRIVALTEVVWHCIHITSETDAAKVDEVLTGAGA